LIGDLRKLLLTVSPETLLHRGDPARLQLQEIESAFGAAFPATGAVERVERPTDGTYRRLGRPGLEPLIRKKTEAK
jgi:hypothetical protein